MSQVAQQDEVLVKAVVAFHETMEHPSVGFAIEDDDHRVVFAANTQWTQERTGTFAAGDQATFSLRLRNVFSPGRFHVSCAVAGRGTGLDLADQRPRMRSFVSTGTRVSGGLVDLDHELVIERGAHPAPAAS